jgi:glycosyltransferase involved in cell wall biosynthesis
MSEHSHPLRVGFYVFFPGGGIGRYTHRLMETMGRRSGVEVEAICTPDYEWAGADGYATWDGLSSISHDIATLRRWRFLKGQFVNPTRAVEHAVSTGLDVLHLANINHLTFPYWRSQIEKSDVRVVASAHDIKRGKSILSRLWEDRQLKSFYRFADALFVHSDYQVRELSAFADVSMENIHVVPHGLYSHGSASASQDTLREKWGFPTHRQVALFFGQIRDEKNLDGLLRALTRTERPPHLVVAGSGSSRHHGVDHYQGLADTLGLTDRVTFIPRFIEDEEVAELFVASDWMALPYKNTFTSQSGVLNVAAKYERPVLVSSAPVLRETVRTCDIGVACSGDGPESLAEGIEAMQDRLETGHTHAFEAYREQFSWEENVSRTLTVYEKLLS